MGTTTKKKSLKTYTHLLFGFSIHKYRPPYGSPQNRQNTFLNTQVEISHVSKKKFKTNINIHCNSVEKEVFFWRILIIRNSKQKGKREYYNGKLTYVLTVWKVFRFLTDTIEGSILFTITPKNGRDLEIKLTRKITTQYIYSFFLKQTNTLPRKTCTFLPFYLNVNLSD